MKLESKRVQRIRVALAWIAANPDKKLPDIEREIGIYGLSRIVGKRRK